MLVPKMQNLILVVAVIVVIILSTFLVIGPSRMTAQAENKLPLFATQAQQEVGTHLAYQGVYTNPNMQNFPSDTEPQAGQLRVVTDLKSAISGSRIDPQSINSGFEYIPSSAFRSDGDTPASQYSFVPIRGYILSNSAIGMCLAAPVYVPNGATLTEFSMFFVDDSAAYDFTFTNLYRRSHSSPGDAAEEIANLNFLGGIDEATVFEAFTASITPGAQTVSNSFGYYIGFCFNGNTGLEQLVYGFRVEYNP